MILKLNEQIHRDLHISHQILNNNLYRIFDSVFMFVHVYASLIRINHNVMVVLHCIKTYILQNHLIISEAHTKVRDDFEISCLEQKMWFYYTMIEDRIKIFGVCSLHQKAKEKISNLFVIFKFDCKRKWLRIFQPSLGLW